MIKRTLLLLFVFLWLSASALAADIVVHAADDLQAKINSSNCADTITLDAGSTWDGTFNLPNKSCSVSTPITLRSSALASLPNGHDVGFRKQGTTLSLWQKQGGVWTQVATRTDATYNSGGVIDVLIVDVPFGFDDFGGGTLL